MFSNKKIIFPLILIFFSIIIFYFLFGTEYSSIYNTQWLSSGDLSTYQIGWNFFKNDQWRFPLGQNPNYGMDIGGSIVYSDSLPLFAIIFKIFKNFLPFNFQYFSLWIFISIFLQFFFFFQIIKKKTNNYNYALIGSIFFGLAPIFIHRTGIHLTLVGQWIILSGFYIEILDTKYKNLLRRLNILLSATIHFYFTILLIIFYFIIKFDSFFFKKEKFYPIIRDIFLTILSLVLLMYIIGYFEFGVDDALGWGYGYYNFNLNSFFNSSGFNNLGTFSWSQFLPSQKIQNYEYEGFSYLGLSGIIFFIIFIYGFILKKDIFLLNKKITLLVIFVFLPLAISNNINFGPINIIHIELNKFIYGFFSIIRASGRLIWPIYYLIFFTGIIFFYNNFNNPKKRILIIIFLLSLQIFDLSTGLKNYYLGNAYKITKNNSLSDNIWTVIPKKFDKLRTFYKVNYSSLFYKLSEYLKRVVSIETDIFHLSRIDREKTVSDRYKLIDDLNNYNFPEDTIFVSDNYNYIRHMKLLFNNKIKLNYYFRDDLWLVSSKKIVENNNVDENLINRLFPKILNYNNKINFNFNNHDSYYGLGWSKENDEDGIWTDGFHSSILFSINKDECRRGSMLNLLGDIFPNRKDRKLNLKLFLNKKFVKELELKKNGDNMLSLNIDCQNDESFLIDLIIINPLSERELLSGLNTKKKGFLLKSMYLSN